MGTLSITAKWQVTLKHDLLQHLGLLPRQKSNLIKLPNSEIRAGKIKKPLLRAVLQNEPAQAAAASELLRSAELMAVSLPSLCELVWTLQRGAKLSREEVAQTVRDLLNTEKVTMNRLAVETGLSVLEAGRCDCLRRQLAGWQGILLFR